MVSDPIARAQRPMDMLSVLRLLRLLLVLGGGRPYGLVTAFWS